MTLKRAFFLPGIAPLAFVPCLVSLIASALLFGCISSPFHAAQSPAQKAYAVYGTFVIVEKQGAALVTDPTVSLGVKRAIQAADARAKPTTDALLQAFLDYESAETALKAGTGTTQKVQIAESHLNSWLTAAEHDVNTLLTAVRSH